MAGCQINNSHSTKYRITTTMHLFYKSQPITESGILREMTDHHSHVLPGVDDGVKTMDESLTILYLMESQGIHKVWLTPHVMEDMPNTTLLLKEKFEELQAAYRGTIELNLAAEYMMDNLFKERLEAGDLLLLCESDYPYLLVETSCFNPPMNLSSILKHIQKKGYRPLLAHPERYMYMDKSDYRALKQEQIAFQLNLPSLTGAYGAHVQKKAASLLKAGMYDLTGTDMHSPEHFREWLGTQIGSRDRDTLSARFPACHGGL
jgi:protein-tyrosine phosphatase